MGTQTKTLYGVITVLIALVIIVSGVAGLYYYDYTQAQSANQVYILELKQFKSFSNILIDYGNGTETWYNNTRVQAGWNLYVTTQLVTNGHVNATYYPQYDSHFVTSIYNVANTKTTYWLIFIYNSTALWQSAQVGPDQLLMYNGSTYAWHYCGANCTGP